MAASITQTANPAGVSSSSNVATYTGVSIGAAAENRIVVVNVTTELTAASITSVTCGGVAMNAGTQGNQGVVYARTFYLLYSTGTTANIVVTYGANATSTQNHISVYRVIGAAYSSTGADQSTDMDATDPLTTGSTVVGTGGLIIAVAGCATDTVAKTWANITEDLDVDAGGLRHTTAFSTTAGTATRTCTGATNGEDGALSYLIFANNTSPTVALNSPADAATGVIFAPILDFTGTDAEADSIEYEVQVATGSFTTVPISTLTSGLDEDGGSASTTASITLTANRLGLLTVASRTGITADPNMPTVTGWTLVDTQVYDSTSSSRRRLTLLRRLDSSDSTGTITIDFGGQNQTDVVWIVDEATNVDTTGTNGSGAVVQYAKSVYDNEAVPVISLTTTLSAFSNTNNATFGAFGWDGNDAITVGSGFTKLTEQHDSVADVACVTEYKTTNDTSVDASFSPGTGLLGGIAIEIKAATQMIVDAFSVSDAGFVNPDTGSDTHPFNSGENIQYTVQSDLPVGTFYWRVRGIDPSGSNTYGAWATTRSFTTGVIRPTMTWSP